MNYYYVSTPAARRSPGSFTMRATLARKLRVAYSSMMTWVAGHGMMPMLWSPEPITPEDMALLELRVATPEEIDGAEEWEL